MESKRQDEATKVGGTAARLRARAKLDTLAAGRGLKSPRPEGTWSFGPGLQLANVLQATESVLGPLINECRRLKLDVAGVTVQGKACAFRFRDANDAQFFVRAAALADARTDGNMVSFDTSSIPDAVEAIERVQGALRS
jgi:hypothetical protein